MKFDQLTIVLTTYLIILFSVLILRTDLQSLFGQAEVEVSTRIMWIGKGILWAGLAGLTAFSIHQWILKRQALYSIPIAFMVITCIVAIIGHF